MGVERTCQGTADVLDELDAIIAELDVESNVLPESALRDAQRRKAMIIPRLVNLIEKATLSAQAGVSPTGNGHFFALFLLTEFQAKEALPAILDVLRLPGEKSYELFGDAITECQVLAQLAVDAPSVIDELISNQSVDEFIRWIAAQTFIYWVRDGHMTREDAVARLDCHLSEAIDNRDDEGVTPLVIELLKYAPHEAIETIIEAFELDLIDLEVVDLDCVKASLIDCETCLQTSFNSLHVASVTDSVELLRKWACFGGHSAEATDHSNVATYGRA